MEKASDYFSLSSTFQCVFCEQHKLWRPCDEDHSDFKKKSYQGAVNSSHDPGLWPSVLKR